MSTTSVGTGILPDVINYRGTLYVKAIVNTIMPLVTTGNSDIDRGWNETSDNNHQIHNNNNIQIVRLNSFLPHEAPDVGTEKPSSGTENVPAVVSGTPKNPCGSDRGDVIYYVYRTNTKIDNSPSTKTIISTVSRSNSRNTVNDVNGERNHSKQGLNDEQDNSDKDRGWKSGNYKQPINNNIRNEKLLNQPASSESVFSAPTSTCPELDTVQAQELRPSVATPLHVKEGVSRVGNSHIDNHKLRDNITVSGSSNNDVSGNNLPHAVPLVATYSLKESNGLRVDNPGEFIANSIAFANSVVSCVTGNDSFDVNNVTIKLVPVYSEHQDNLVKETVPAHLPVPVSAILNSSSDDDGVKRRKTSRNPIHKAETTANTTTTYTTTTTNTIDGHVTSETGVGANLSTTGSNISSTEKQQVSELPVRAEDVRCAPVSVTPDGFVPKKINAKSEQPVAVTMDSNLCEVPEDDSNYKKYNERITLLKNAQYSALMDTLKNVTSELIELEQQAITLSTTNTKSIDFKIEELKQRTKYIFEKIAEMRGTKTLPF